MLNVSLSDQISCHAPLDVFDAFPVETDFVSGDPNSTQTYNAFLHGVRDEGAKVEVLWAGMLMD